MGNFENEGEIVFGNLCEQEQELTAIPELIGEITQLLENQFEKKLNMKIEECVKMHYSELLIRLE